MPRVSVLLTSYNHIQHLPEALDSIRSQTFQDLEIIAVDDGSTDGSRDLLREQEDITLIETESNLGTYAALNLAVKAATGEFVAIFNDDDVWKPEKLAKQVEMLDSMSDVGMVHTSGWFIDGEGERIDGRPLGFAFPETKTGDLLLDLVRANQMITSSVMARREIIIGIGGFEESLYGSADWLTWIRVAESWNIGFVPDALTLYRVHAGSASRDKTKVWQDDEKVRTWLEDRIPVWLEKGYSDADMNSAQAHNAAALGTVLKLNGKPKEAKARFKKALKLEPTIKRRVWLLASSLPVSLFQRLVR
jgi:glycosyltransferase involved in cell wall biosynthesis